MVIFAYFFIPQIFFYGMDSLLGAILNVRGRFGANMWTPVINNVVVILVGVLFHRHRRDCTRHPANIPPSGIYLLGDRHHCRHRDPVDRAVPRSPPRRVQHAAAVGPAARARSPRSAGWPAGCSATSARQWVGNLVVQRVANAAANTASPRCHRRRVLGLLLRLAAVPAAVRDRRDLGDQRAAAADERARHRPAVLAGPRRLLDGRPARLGHRGPGGRVPRRARPAAVQLLFAWGSTTVGERAVHRRGVRRVLPRPGGVHADPAAAARLLLVPGEQDPGDHRHGDARRRRDRRSGRAVRAARRRRSSSASRSPTTW